jgi:CubicO group peptidase (beta-lactamase class C family)
MPSGKRCIITIVVVVLLSLPCLGNAASTLVEANEQTRQLVRQTMKEQRIPGLQVAIIKDDKVVLSESYGLANVENRVPVTNETLFPINSATKSFTGVAMMQLAEAGLLDLNAPVSRYLADLPKAWQGVRVRQLLAHTSGLPNIVDRQGLIGGGTELDAWKAVKEQPMVAPIGEQFAYNQTNYGLLAQIIIKQTKMPFERYFAERQFAVAGMRTSTFGDSYDLVANSATIYSYSRRRMLVEGDDNRLAHWIDDLPPGLRTGGGIQTTADELARWIIALSKGSLISAISVNSMWTPEKLNNGADGKWAAGWPVLRTSPDRQVAGIGGGRSAFVVYPDDRLAIIVLTNLVGASPENFIPHIAEFYEPFRSERSK